MCSQQEKVTGAIVVTTDMPISHSGQPWQTQTQHSVPHSLYHLRCRHCPILCLSVRPSGLKLVVEGSVSLQLSARSIGLFEAFSSSLKPIALLRVDIDVNSGSKLPQGSTPFPFEFFLKPLASSPTTPLFDTYHGVYVNIHYTVTASLQPRGLMAKSIVKQKEILLEAAPNPSPSPCPSFSFRVSPDSLQNVKDASKRRIPDFVFEGRLESTNCNIARPLLGELTIVKSAVDVKSIELQLVRVESCSYMEGEAREATEIQNIQIAEGNVLRGVALPIYMVFPRLFCCSTTIAKGFRVEFEVNLIVLFADNHMVTENFPIKLFR